MFAHKQTKLAFIVKANSLKRLCVLFVNRGGSPDWRPFNLNISTTLASVGTADKER